MTAKIHPIVQQRKAEQEAKYMGKSPLLWMTDHLKDRRVTALTLCAYDVDENYQAFRRDRVLVDINHVEEGFAKLVAEAKKQGNHEVGICSTVMRPGLEENHVLFCDLDNYKGGEKAFDGWLIVQSSKAGTHAYTHITDRHFGDVMARLLHDDLFKHIDTKWMRCGLGRGFNVLRLTNLTERFADEPAPVIVGVPY